MYVDGESVRREQQHGQDVFIPSWTHWRAIIADGKFGEVRINSPEDLSSFVERYSVYEEISLGAALLHGRWMIIPLLKVEGHTYRVRFEDVICEHCARRCGFSAAPDLVSYVGTRLSVAEASAEFVRLGVKKCPHCSGVLSRRQTAWFAPAVEN